MCDPEVGRGGGGSGRSPGVGLTPMEQRYTRPDWVRRLNAMGPAAGGAARMVPLVAGHLVDHARASTGVDDPGDLGDGDWEGRLRALVEAVDASDLHVVGRMLTREELLRSLRTRLLMADAKEFGDFKLQFENMQVLLPALPAPCLATHPAR